MIEAILFMAIVPLALLMMLAYVLLKSRMNEAMRKRAELGLTLILYPAFILGWAWHAWDNQQQGDWLAVGMYLVLVGLFAVQFVLALRTRTLFPRFRTT